MKRIFLVISLLILGLGAFSQQFEDQKSDIPEFDKIKVKVGGDFAIQLQALDHSNTNDTIAFYDMVNNFNLPTANLNLDVYLAYGVKMHLRTYLSSRHHTEAWVKG